MPNRIAATILAALLALPAAAQQYPSQARGLGGAVAYQTGDVDHVNLFNGQLSITLPLGQGYPVGPGLGAGLAFTYTSNLWDFNELQTCSTPGGILSYYPPEIDPQTNAGPGGRVSLGKLEEPFAPDTRWRYFPPDGGEVLFYPTLHPGFPSAGAQPDPLGNDTVSYFSTSHVLHSWSYGLPFTRCNPSYSINGPFLSQELYQGSVATGTKVRSMFVEYESDGRDGGEHQQKNHRRVYSKTVYHDDGDRFREVRFSDFDGLGHYRMATTGGNFGSGNVRTSTTTFNPGSGTLLVIDPDTSQLGGNFSMPAANASWILGTFTESRVSEGGLTAIEEFCFDTSTGFLERHRTLAGTSRANGDLLEVMTAATTGHVETELFYGGDAQGAMDNVYSNLCEMSLAGLDAQYQLEHTWAFGSLETTQWIDPCDHTLELLSLDHSIDQSTGMVSVSRDPAGVAMSYDFDEMGRLIAERAAQGAWIEIEYTLPTIDDPSASPQVITQTCSNGVTSCSGANLLAWHRMRSDRLGRAREEAQRVPGVSGLALQERQFNYNALGWTLSQTAWGDFSKLTTWSGHDRFGRPGQVQLPTEAPMRYAYLGERVMTREESVATGAGGAETSAFTTEIVDGQGRLEQVCENQASAWAGSCPGTLTRYEYGVIGTLSRVCQNASGATCGQERRFDVDRRGFLLGEKHPEIGPSGNGWSNYAYDALGNVLSRTIAGSSDFDLDYRYDKAGRLIKLTERNDPNGPRPLKEFFYGHQNTGNDKRAGKLYMSRRHNWVDPVGPLDATGSLDLVVSQTYFYEGLDGRISKRLTSLKVPQITTYAFETDFTWNHLGLIDDIAYPQCLHTKCAGRDPPRTVSYDYSRGFLTAVPGYASAIDYQGGGMLHQIQHTNGVTYTMERESASALDRPFRISTNRGWSTGNFSYDGAGQIKQIGTQDFRYDRFKRLTSGEVTIGTQDRVQSASYDVYNNLLSLTTNGSALTTSVNTATNRLTGFSATYDAFGSLTQQIRNGETHKYTWDPLGMLKYLQSTTDQAQVFLYDADDERLAVYDCFPGVCDSPGWELRTTVRGLGGEPLREYSTQGVDGWHWERDYVYRGGALLAAVEPNGQGGENVLHLHPDHLGTPRQITNASGAQVALHSYYPFGQEATVPTQTSFTKKFTGHERDDNGASLVGDLDYMHARYGSPTLGRFLSFDPIGGSPRSPQSWNRYAYALNSPMNYTDPEGLFALLFMDLAFVVFDEITVTSRHALWNFSDTINLRVLLGWAPEFNFERQTTARLQYGAVRGGELESHALGREIELYDNAVLEFGLSGVAGLARTASRRVVSKTAKTLGETLATQAAGGNQVGRSSQKSIRSLERRLAEHRAKLEAYRKNPSAFDNLKRLENAETPAIQQRIIEGRIQKLEKEIVKFEREIAKIQEGG